VIDLILAGIYYKYAGPHFRPHPYHAVPQLSIATVVVTLAVLAMTYAAFAKPNINFTITVFIYLFSRHQFFC
jgi:hypothetical protein